MITAKQRSNLVTVYASYAIVMPGTLSGRLTAGCPFGEIACQSIGVFSGKKMVRKRLPRLRPKRKERSEITLDTHRLSARIGG
jgi:hypothetical protein